MKIYIYKNGTTQGPYHRNELIDRGLNPDTPVWYSGLAGWTPAGQAECTRWLFDPVYQSRIADYRRRHRGHQAPQAGAPFVGRGSQCPPCAGYQPPVYGPQQGSGYNNPGAGCDMPKPDNYIWLSVITMVCCCLPFGIVALLKSNEVDNAYALGDYERARRASNAALTWGIVAVVCGFVFSILYFLLQFFAAF